MIMSSLKTSALSKQIITYRYGKLPSINLLLVSSMMMLGLSACQTAPTNSVTQTSVQTTPIQTTPASQPSSATPSVMTQSPAITKDGEDNYPVAPNEVFVSPESPNPLTQETPVYAPTVSEYTQPEVIITPPSRNDYIISEPSVPSHNDLLEQARKNSQQRSQQSTSNNSSLPAFRNLMQVGVNQLKAGQLTNAENSFTRAQRLAPKSSAVYFYLAQVALKKNQPRKAEAMARRGLSVSQDASRRRALWQVILQSGQAQGNARVVSEAKQALR